MIEMWCFHPVAERGPGPAAGTTGRFYSKAFSGEIGGKIIFKRTLFLKDRHGKDKPEKDHEEEPHERTHQESKRTYFMKKK